MSFGRLGAVAQLYYRDSMMRKPGGFLEIIAPDARSRTVFFSGRTINDTARDTFSCGHCNRVVAVEPMCDAADMGGLCKQCMRLICPECYGVGSCTPLEVRIEEQEARGRFIRQMQEWG